MKIEIDGKEMVKKLAIAMRGVASKSTTPILESVHLKTDEFLGEITLSGFNSDLGIRTIAEGSVLEDGEVCINAKLLNEIVRKLPDGKITLETEELEGKDPGVTISSGKAVFHISGKNGMEFPAMPEITNPVSEFKISQFDLRELVRQTAFCCTTDNTNKLFGTINMSIQKNSLMFIALDGHRIAFRRKKLEGAAEMDINAPVSTMNEIYKILNGGTEEEVSVTVARSMVAFETESTTVISRLVDGEYFKALKMISNNFSTQITVKRRDAIEIIERCELLNTVEDRKPLILDIEGDQVTMKLISIMGQIKESMDAEKKGQDMVVGFNPLFLREALGAIDDDSVEIYFIPKGPAAIRNGAGNDWDYYYMVLPVNINHQ